MRFPVRGSEAEVKSRVEELKKRGYTPLHDPKLIISASLTRKPQFIVIMHGEEKR